MFLVTGNGIKISAKGEGKSFNVSIIKYDNGDCLVDFYFGCYAWFDGFGNFESCDEIPF